MHTELWFSATTSISLVGWPCGWVKPWWKSSIAAGDQWRKNVWLTTPHVVIRGRERGVTVFRTPQKTLKV